MVGPARPEGSTLKLNRAGARTKNGARNWAEAALAIRSIAPSRRGHPAAARAGQFQAGRSSVARQRLNRKIIQKRCSLLNQIFQGARTKNGHKKAAERKRSRSEADTEQWVGLCFCDSQSRAGRSFRPRRPATDVAFGPRRLRPLELRANSVIPRGIAVLGESDALAARGGRARGRIRQPWAVNGLLLLRLVEPRSSPPPRAAGCTRRGSLRLRWRRTA